MSNALAPRGAALPTMRTIVAALVAKLMQPLYSLSARTNVWWPVRESYTGAWQQNVTIGPPQDLLTFSAVFSCVTGIAGDVSKMRIKLVRDQDGVWEEVREFSPYGQVLLRPNHFQTTLKFVEGWIVSKLLNGNTYVLKRRDARGIVTDMYVLDPLRVTPLITTSGDVYYELKTDHLSDLPDLVVVPAKDIIHDTMVCLFHPLIGVSPLYACGITTTMGTKIQSSQINLFGNAARPGGILTAPGHIEDDTAARLKTSFEADFSGANVGRLAVLGDGLKFEPMILAPEVLQLIEQLKWTVEDVARAFHYPAWKLGGPVPPYSGGPEAVTMMYYTDCLQVLIEAMEAALDRGLEFPPLMHAELEVENLVRMDTASLYATNNAAVSGGWMSPNEARYRANMKPVTGGNSPVMQAQNYSLAALADRDSDKPFAKPTPAASPSDSQQQQDQQPEGDAGAKALEDFEAKALFQVEWAKAKQRIAS